MTIHEFEETTRQRVNEIIDQVAKVCDGRLLDDVFTALFSFMATVSVMNDVPEEMIDEMCSTFKFNYNKSKEKLEDVKNSK
jgi:hypothetical protein